MVVLAFLQNSWVSMRRPEYIARLNAWEKTRPIKYHLKSAEAAIFGGCISGKKLLAAGFDRDKIVWANASRELTLAVSPAGLRADVKHMQEVIDEVKPDVIIAFGKVAGRGLEEVQTAARRIYGPHPARCSYSALTEVLDQLRV
jgi:hypothetical protein